MWEYVELPSFRGLIEGFTFPTRNVILVLTADGLIRIALDPVEVRHVADLDALSALFDRELLQLTWEDERHQVYSDDGGDIPLQDHASGDRIVLAEDGSLLITDPSEREIRQRITSVRVPEDGSWIYVGFSEDNRWLVAGEPQGIQVFRRVPTC